MAWTPGRPAPSTPRPAERVLFTLVKTARSARAVERVHPLGREVVLLVAGELLWSRTFRHGDDAAFEAEVEAARVAFIQRGWQPATV